MMMRGAGRPRAGSAAGPGPQRPRDTETISVGADHTGRDTRPTKIEHASRGRVVGRVRGGPAVSAGIVGRVPRSGPAAVAMLILLCASGVQAQAPAGRGGPPAAPATPRTQAPIDLTGQWVAIISEDWRWRMVTPSKGDYASIPMSPAAQKVADAWDPAKDEAAGRTVPGLWRAGADARPDPAADLVAR